LKLRNIATGLLVTLMGFLLVQSSPQISRSLLRRTIVYEIPRYDFRIQVERVWKGDMVRLDIEVQGGEGDLYLFVERSHFYIPARQEFGPPARVITHTLQDSSLIVGSDTATFTADLEGHLNILLNNTLSPQPKTVRYFRVFLRSTNVEYTTLIIRNVSLLVGAAFILIGLIENYELRRERLELFPNP